MQHESSAEINSYEHMKYIDETACKEKFALIQVLKLYYLIKYQKEEIKLDYIIEKLEIILKNKPIQLHPTLIHEGKLIDRINNYFSKGFDYMVSKELKPLN